MKTNKDNEIKFGKDNRVISFEELHLISTQNKGKFNRNVWTEKVLEKDPSMKNWEMIITPLMEHNYHLGEPIEPHLRCAITTGKELFGDYLLQDISFEQWNSLRTYKECGINE